MMKTIVTGVLFLLSTLTYAEGWYAGLGYSMLDADLKAGGSTSSTEPTGINVTAGYQFTKHFALEGLVGFGLSDDDVENATFDFELESLFGVVAVGTLPLSENFNFYGKLGAVQIDYDDSDGDSSDASGAMYGVGATYNFSETFGVNIEVVEYPDGDYDDFDIDVEASALNIGFVARF